MLKKIRLSLLVLSGAFVVNSHAQSVTFQENFANNPLASGWKVFGNNSLFVWNSTNQNMEVTWDSSQSNSYFYRTLPTVLAKDDDFSFSFDLRMSQITVGPNTNRPHTFQFAIGLLRIADATKPGFIRGSGYESPNLVEFDYFPKVEYDASVSTVLVSSNNEFSSGGFTFPLEMTTNDLFHITLDYTATNQILKTIMTKNGQPFGPIQDAFLTTNFSDFRVDTVSISSYSDVGQFPGYEGSILARGTVDNFLVTTPPSPIGNFKGTLTNDFWQADFGTRTNWVYGLDRSSDFQSWTNVTSLTAGNGANLALRDTNAPPAKAFYRIRADRP